ncbi:MAG: methylated-DNA--[protein]-cysteine S-methyltransferase [Roseivirga sp.]|nr:methylated-DNA--[protein]-cysteine S-methyltransferase [Roseivirga sp.]
MHDYYRIAEALNYISQNREQQPNLETIAEQVHLSPFHFQRLFSDWAGVSPKKFLQYISLEHAKQILRDKSGSVYEAAYDTGFSSTGRLHDLFVTIEGMTPGQYKNGGENLTIHYSFHECQFGNYLLASTQSGICNILFFEKTTQSVVDELRELWPNARLLESAGPNDEAVKAFFNKSLSTDRPLRLHLKGTDFQIKVWEALLRIPEAAMVSYGEIAHSIQKPSAQRAVGTAIGSNPIAYIIPCHRVIKSVGKIGEYRWGKHRKTAMLGWEQAQEALSIE